MPFRIEFSAEAERDFALIFDHLFDSYRSFGESVDEALAHATQRLQSIRRSADRLATAPQRGARHDDLLPGLRHLTIEQAIFWFEADETNHRLRILAIFFGSQDHIRHMLTRLLR